MSAGDVSSRDLMIKRISAIRLYIAPGMFGDHAICESSSSAVMTASDPMGFGCWRIG
jgi:hypothetical protein